jgi:hypothetical protein
VIFFAPRRSRLWKVYLLELFPGGVAVRAVESRITISVVAVRA